MKLSEAILLGSIGSEQGFGPSSMQTNSPRKCAMGSALLAVGIMTDNDDMDKLTPIWPWVSVEVAPPVDLVDYKGCTKIIEKATIPGIIWRLNDILKWTRPQIAAWVATQEAIYDVQPVEQPIMESTLVTR